MSLADSYLPPPKLLAVTRAPRDYRAHLSLLLRFDARLGGIVARGAEAIVGQMRMAWWRDVISKPAALRPKGEPMVAQLCDLEPIAGPPLAAAMLDIVDGWDLLLAEEAWTVRILIEHATMRGQAVFGNEIARTISARWALHDLANIISVDAAAALDAIAQDGQGTVALRDKRHLSILAMAARQQYEGSGSLSGVRLLLHSLTGL